MTTTDNQISKNSTKVLIDLLEESYNEIYCQESVFYSCNCKKCLLKIKIKATLSTWDKP